MPLFDLPSCLLQLLLARDVSAWPDNTVRRPTVPENLSRWLQSTAAGFRHLYPHIAQGRPDFWEVVQLMAWCSLLPGFWYLRRRRKEPTSKPWRAQDALPGARSPEIDGKLPRPLTSTVADPRALQTPRWTTQPS
jgi:hypothetical protein